MKCSISIKSLGGSLSSVFKQIPSFFFLMVMLILLGFNAACDKTDSGKYISSHDGKSQDSSKIPGDKSLPTHAPSPPDSSIQQVLQNAINQIGKDQKEGFAVAQNITGQSFVELRSDERKALLNLCRSVAASTKVDPQDRFSFLREKVPASQLPFILDDFIMSLDDAEIAEMDEIIRKELPPGEARTQAISDLVTRMYELGKTQEELKSWALALEFPEEQKMAMLWITHHYK